MSVQEKIPYVSYIANGSTAKFNIPFDLHNAGYLVVTVDKMIPAVGGYIVNLNDMSITFVTAPRSGAQVELYRDTKLKRDTNYQSYDNSFRPSSVNFDFDSIWQALQDQHMVDARIAARIREEIEQRRVADGLMQGQIEILNQVILSVFNDASSEYVANKLTELHSLIQAAAAAAAGANGWIASLVVYKGENLQDVLEHQENLNAAQAERNKDQINARDWGILPTNSPEVNSANWFALNNAFPERPALDIFVPIGTYNFSEGFYVTRPHHIYGVGVGELCKTVFNFSGSTPVGTVHYKASVFIVHSSTVEDTSGNGVTLPVGQVGVSGTGATIDCIKIMNSSEHGIIKNAPSYLNGVAAMNNAKHGILTVANTGTGWPRISGIANQGSNTECAALFNEWSGIVEIGDDANVIKSDTCLSAYNNQFGFYDASLLGGVCINNQAHVNILGDYVQQGSAHDNSGLPITPSKTVYVGNYAEEQRPSAYSTNGRSIVLSATGAQPESHNTNALLASVVGLITQGRFSVSTSAQNVYDRRGGNFVSIGLNEILFGSASAPNSNFRIKASDNGRVGISIADSKNAMVFFLEDFNTTLKAERPWFLNGLTMGSTHYQTAGTAAPTTGTWDGGNIVWNEAPASGGKIGWVCVEGGSPGVWKAFGSIDA